jgi:chromosome segregation ATPase
MSYDDNVLIKLRRDYSKDEVVLHLIKTVKNLKTEVGKLSSYIDELKHRIDLKKDEIKDLNKKISNARQLHKVRQLEEKIKKTNRENERIKLENKELREKLQLKDECNNLT